MNFEIVAASEVSLTEQAWVANVAFANYVGGWADMDANALARFLVLQGTDLYYSRFIRSAAGLVGFGYINRTGHVLRLSGMAIVPHARGTGAAGQLLARLFDEARARGDGTMMLEVIEQNPRAVALYRRHGFREVARLVGWRRTTAAIADSGVALEEISILNALRLPAAREYPTVPWQISRYALAKAEQTIAFRAGDHCIVISEVNATMLRVQGILSATEDWHELRQMLAAIVRRYPGREFFAPAVWPEEFGRELFAPLGFTREAISQFLMRLDFEPR